MYNMEFSKDHVHCLQNELIMKLKKISPRLVSHNFMQQELKPERPST